MAQRFFVGNNTNWTVTSSWSTTSGGGSGASVPTNADDVILDANSPGTANINTGAPVCRSLDATNFTHTLAWSATGSILTVGGSTSNGTLSFKLGASVTITSIATGSNPIVFVSTSGTQEQVTTAGKTLPAPKFNGAGGSWQLQDGFTTAGAFTLTSGTLDLNGTTNSWGSFVSTGSTTRVFTAGAATITLSGTGNVWNLATTGATYSVASTSITISDTSSSTKTFTGQSQTYGTVTVTAGGVGAVTMTGGNTFTLLSIGAPNTIIFQNGSTNTCTNLIARGSSGNVITFQSNSSGIFTNWAQPATVGGISLAWCSFQDIKNNGPATVWAGANSTSVSHNSGITFTAPAITESVTQATSTTAVRGALATARTESVVQTLRGTSSSDPLFPNAGLFPNTSSFPQAAGGVLSDAGLLWRVAHKASATQAQATARFSSKSASSVASATQATATTVSEHAVTAAVASVTQATSSTAAPSRGQHPARIIASQATKATRGPTNVGRRLRVAFTPPLLPSVNRHPSPGLYPTAGVPQTTGVTVSHGGVHSSSINIPQPQDATVGGQTVRRYAITQATAAASVANVRLPRATTQATSTTTKPIPVVVRTITQPQPVTVARHDAFFRTLNVAQDSHTLFSSVAEYLGAVDVRQPQDTTVQLRSNRLTVQLSLLQPTVFRARRQTARHLALSQATAASERATHLLLVSATQPTAVVGVGFPFGPIIVFLPLRSQPQALGLKSQPRELEVV